MISVLPAARHAVSPGSGTPAGRTLGSGTPGSSIADSIPGSGALHGGIPGSGTPHGGIPGSIIPGAGIPGRVIPGSGLPGPGIGRAAARGLARHELSKPIYHQHPPLIVRILRALSRLLGGLHAGVNATIPGGWWTLVGVMALAVIIAGAALWRLGPVARPHRRKAVLGGGRPLTAAEHRMRAHQLAGGADWSGAIRECFRAIARELEERYILPVRPGRTARELAAEAAAALPGLAGAFREAAALFDDVCYGERPGTAQAYATLNDLDNAVRSARPVPRTPPAPPAPPAQADHIAPGRTDRTGRDVGPIGPVGRGPGVPA